MDRLLLVTVRIDKIKTTMDSIIFYIGTIKTVLVIQIFVIF